jgi:PPM family protein phosphatase
VAVGPQLAVAADEFKGMERSRPAVVCILFLPAFICANRQIIWHTATNTPALGGSYGGLAAICRRCCLPSAPSTRSKAFPAGDMIRFSHGVDTSVGRVRRVNEDSYLAVPPIYAVADGMGGHGSGDVASRLAVETLARCVMLRPLFTEAVLHALQEANRVIIEHDGPNRMGTTITGLAGLETMGGDRLIVFNVGDSRVYRLAGERVEQLTVDHSEVQELVLAGVLTPEQARTHPRRNVVTRALGGGPDLAADHWLVPATVGDRFLICSDGLFGELPDEALAPLLAIPNPQQAAGSLVAAANDAGGHDNITALVVDIESSDAPEFRPIQGGPAERGGTGGGTGGPSGGIGGAGELPTDVGLFGLGLIGPDPDPRGR